MGCGTGHSALALTKYCSRFHGVEPSRAMLERAMPHAQSQLWQIVLRVDISGRPSFAG
ncbi:methyltransferase domain-containing protein [Exilibacterium tricleocarpae]|uniref:methyltransferase domain-containing protein n=1 Tax=Exilibacterium tricleocarpae TaxID=2591008 RepID=UPI003CCC4ADE